MNQASVLSIMKVVAITIIICGTIAVAGENRKNKDSTLPVFAVDADNGFPFLMAKMQGAKAILLGDATHGTEEYYSFRKRITRNLIKKQGLRVVILEAEWDSAELVNNYVHGRLDPDTGVRSLLSKAFFRWPQWVWANEEMVEFVLWVKEFNSSRDRDAGVSIYGMDMQMAVESSLKRLSDILDPNSHYAKKLEELRKWWQPYVDNPILFKQAFVSGNEPGNLLATEIQLGLQEKDDEVRRLLRMLIDVERYYRVMAKDEYEAWNIRSKHFSDYILRLIFSEQGETGVVVWAHNSHVGDMRGTDVQGANIVNTGQLLSQRLGDEHVFIVGSAGYQGTVLAAEEWDSPVREMIIPPPMEGSFEMLLGRQEWDNPMLLFENEKQRESWSLFLNHRGIGVSYQPENEVPDNYLYTRMGYRYDAVVFWKTTSSLQPILPD